jgi:hypothetical protein
VRVLRGLDLKLALGRADTARHEPTVPWALSLRADMTLNIFGSGCAGPNT